MPTTLTSAVTMLEAYGRPIRAVLGLNLLVQSDAAYTRAMKIG